jgi:hypothetical protein
MKQTPRRLIGMLIAIGALVALPASAQAAFNVTATAAPTDTSAGAHSDFHIHMDFGGGQVRDLTVGLPPGLIGDPTATPKCTVAELNAANCPDDTKVGEVNATATILSIVGPVPVTGFLYNLDPQPGEPARFGIVLHPVGIGVVPAIILQSAVQLRGDYGLDTIINSIPNTTLTDGDTTITSQDITLYGIAPGTGKPFMRNPTSCAEKTTTISATPYSGSADSADASFTTTNCGALDFSPSFSATIGGPGQTAASLKTTATTSIDQDADEAGLVRAEVAIPPDLNPDVALLGNRCSPTDFQASNCPPSSVMGSAIAASPLLSQALAGNVVFVDTGGTPDIGLDLQGQLHLLLRGTLSLDKHVVFDGLPDIPIFHFQLTFPSSPGLLIASRNLCVPPAPVFHAVFQGYNGASTSVDPSATVEGCGPSGPVTKKCKKAKKKRKHRAAVDSRLRPRSGAAGVSKSHKKRCKKKRKKRR